VAACVGVDARIEHLPLPTDDPRQRQPDIALAERELGWVPTVPLAEGVSRTVQWFRGIDVADYPPPSPNVMQPETQRG